MKRRMLDCSNVKTTCGDAILDSGRCCTNRGEWVLYMAKRVWSDAPSNDGYVRDIGRTQARRMCVINPAVNGRRQCRSWEGVNEMIGDNRCKQRILPLLGIRSPRSVLTAIPYSTTFSVTPYTRQWSYLRNKNTIIWSTFLGILSI